ETSALQCVEFYNRYPNQLAQTNSQRGVLAQKVLFVVVGCKDGTTPETVTVKLTLKTEGEIIKEETFRVWDFALRTVGESGNSFQDDIGEVNGTQRFIFPFEYSGGW